MKFSNQIESLLTLRLASGLIGFIGSFFISIFILDGHGQMEFAIFMAVSTIPNLFPFADFGLGMRLYTFLISDTAENVKLQYKAGVFGSLFRLSVLLSCSSLFVLAIFETYSPNFLKNFLGYGNTQIPSYLFFISIAIMWISVPFSLGSRVLEAESRIGTSIIIQMIIPIIGLLSVLLAYKFQIIPTSLATLSPVIAYFISTVTSFFFALALIGIDFQRKTRLIHVWESSKGVGIWHLILMTNSALIYQLPRNRLTHFGFFDSASKYSLILFWVLPIISFLPIFSTWSAPMVQRLETRVNQDSFLFKQVTKAASYSAITVTLLFLATTYIDFLHYYRFGIAIFLQIILISTLASVWIIPLRILATAYFLKRLALLSSLVLVLIYILTNYFRLNNLFSTLLMSIVPFHFVLGLYVLHYLKRNTGVLRLSDTLSL